MTGGCGTGLTVRVSIAVPVPAEFVAAISTLEAPKLVGVPVIAPVDESTVSPPGRPAAEKLVGRFVALIL